MKQKIYPLLFILSLCALCPGFIAHAQLWYYDGMTLNEYATLKITATDGTNITNFRYQSTLNSDRDEFLGMIVRISSRESSYVARPLGGKPIKSIQWKDSDGVDHLWLLNGESYADFARVTSQDTRIQAEETRKTTEKSTEKQKKPERNTSYTIGRFNDSISARIVRDAKSLYGKWSDKSGVTATYISTAMFQMMGELPSIDLNRPVNLTPIIEKLDGLYMLEFDKGPSRNTASGGLRRDIRDFLENQGYEMLMEKRSGRQLTRMYIAAKGATVTGFVLVRLDTSFNYGQFVCIEGRIPRNKFEEIITSGMQ